jgi:hypothetical protein
LIGRQLAKEHTSCLDAQLARGGILLWVHMRDPSVEKTVLDVLRQQSTKVSIRDDAGKGASTDRVIHRRSSISRPDDISSGQADLGTSAVLLAQAGAMIYWHARTAVARLWQPDAERGSRLYEALHRGWLSPRETAER